MTQAVELSCERTLENGQPLKVHATYFPTVRGIMLTTLSKQALCHGFASVSVNKLMFGVGTNLLLSPGI